MNTNEQATGVKVSLRKVGSEVQVTIVAGAGEVSLTLDDNKSVYSALHDAKESIAEAVEVLRTIAAEAIIFDVTPIDAASVLDGKQVASPVAPAEPPPLPPATGGASA